MFSSLELNAIYFRYVVVVFDCFIGQEGQKEENKSHGLERQ